MYYMYYYFISQEKSSNERVPFEIQPNRQYFVLKSFCRLNLKQNRTSLNIVGVLFEIHLKETIHQSPHKRGCVFPMVIWPAFRMGRYRVNDHPYHAIQFICHQHCRFASDSDCQFNFNTRSSRSFSTKLHNLSY